MSEKERQIKNEAIRLIARLYKDLYLSEEVIHHGSGNKYDKLNNITSYLDKLESVHNKVSETNRHIKYLKQGYYDRYVIKREDIPISYYKHQQEIALERGLGHIELTDTYKRELQDEVIQNQKASIDTWFNYFLSADANIYPFWAKYWAFQGMLKLGVYNKEKGVFHKRTKETVEPFADLNREALAMSIDLVTEMLGRKIEDKKPKNEKEEKRELTELEILVRNGSFPKIYSHILTNLLKNNKNIIKKNTGIWVKYNQGSNHMPLVKSLKGYNTGWCTAGVSTAEMQLRNGDFYVYYTLNENDEYKVPRIAIRMDGNKIAEIRGVVKDQNLEPVMEEVVEEKLKEFPDKEEYYKKVNDMKKLTKIYKKHKNNIELTKEDLRFIYEIDSKIKGFGYEKDPRIEEIIRKRNSERKDLALVLDCTEDEIAFTEEKINSNTVYYKGNLYLYGLTSAEGLILPKIIGGNLYLRGLTSAEGLVLPESIGGYLYLSDLKSAKDLVFPKNIGGDLYLDGLTSAGVLVLPNNIGGGLFLNNLTSAKGLVFPKSIDGDLDLDGLISAEGLVFPNNIGGGLYLSNLTNAKDIVFPKSIGGDLDLKRLIYIKSLVLSKSIGEDLDLSDLTIAEDLVLPNSIGGDLYLNSLTIAKNLVFPNSVGGNLYLNGLTRADGLVLSNNIGGSLYLNSLKSAEGLVFPNNICRDLDLSSLISADGLVLPNSLGGSLNLSGLTSVKGLVLSISLGGDLNLSGLTRAEGLVLPNNIGGSLYLNNLTIAKDLVLPESIRRDLDLRSLIVAEDLVLPKNIGRTLYLNSLTIAVNLTLPEHVGGDVYLESLDTEKGLIIPDNLTYNIHLKYFDITPENVEEYRLNRNK